MGEPAMPKTAPTIALIQPEVSARLKAGISFIQMSFFLIT